MNTPWFNYFLSELRSLQSLQCWDDDVPTQAATTQAHALYSALESGALNGYLDDPETERVVRDLIFDLRQDDYHYVPSYFMQMTVHGSGSLWSSWSYVHSPLRNYLTLTDGIPLSRLFKILRAYQGPLHKIPYPKNMPIFGEACFLCDYRWFLMDKEQLLSVLRGAITANKNYLSDRFFLICMLHWGYTIPSDTLWHSKWDRFAFSLHNTPNYLDHSSRPPENFQYESFPHLISPSRQWERPPLPQKNRGSKEDLISYIHACASAPWIDYDQPFFGSGEV